MLLENRATAAGCHCRTKKNKKKQIIRIAYFLGRDDVLIVVHRDIINSLHRGIRSHKFCVYICKKYILS